MSCLIVHFADLLYKVTNSEAQELLNKLHARELHQRELAQQKLTALPLAKHLTQQSLENARQVEYNTARDLLIQKRSTSAFSSRQDATGLPAHTRNNWKRKVQRRITAVFC